MNRREATWLSEIQGRGDGVQDARVLVACSGGGDSLALLAFLWAVRRSLGLELIVAHADHGLRPEAAEDAQLVGSICRGLDLDLVETRLNVKAHARATRQGVETAARELRWAWLQAEAESCGARAVATGHTLDDHTETVFLRLTRGGGLGALTPLPPRQGWRWSPLVQTRREDLRKYLRHKGLEWREDATNALPFTPRNRWRPLLESIRQEAPALDLHLWETHRQVAEQRAWIEKRILGWRGTRWDLADRGVRLAGAWEAPELRWVLETAFRELDWPRESAHLRDLEAWILERLPNHRRRRHTWGDWQLEPQGVAWILSPGTGDPAAP